MQPEATHMRADDQVYFNPVEEAALTIWDICSFEFNVFCGIHKGSEV